MATVEIGRTRKASRSPFTPDALPYGRPESGGVVIPRSPSPGDKSSQFFLKYHQTTICSSHYFQFFDYHELYTVWLPSMAQECLALRHALVAFSALIYSLKVNPLLRPYAFIYYSSALRELHSLVERTTLKGEDYLFAVATALQLFCLDVPSSIKLLMLAPFR